MPKSRIREEVPNVHFADALIALGLPAVPETIRARGKHRPDVFIKFQGMRIAIEGKIGSNSAERKDAENQTRERVEFGIAQIAIGVLYPSEIRTIDYSKLSGFIKKAKYEYIVISESGTSNWETGDITEIVSSISRVKNELATQDIVCKSAELINSSLEELASVLADNQHVCNELAKVLGIGSAGNKKIDKQKRIKTISLVASLMVANSFIFNEQLAVTGIKNVYTLRSLIASEQIIDNAISSWQWVCDNINYVPIFKVAIEILTKIPSSPESNSAIKFLADKALEVCNNKAALRHDLMGRVYHYLLHEAKFLGTFYTSTPSATLLLKTVFQAKLWTTTKFDSLPTLKDFKIADLTCGTGTLLMASLQALKDNYISEAYKNNKSLKPRILNEFHKIAIEKIVYGYDVLSSAVHLTASTLALLAPEVVFNKMHLYVMPLGLTRNKPCLGSLEFLKRQTANTQYSLPGHEVTEKIVTGAGDKNVLTSIPDMDLIVMNPPFVRSVNGNLLFGTLSDTHRDKLQTDLKKLVAKQNIPANITSGLGSVFVALAARHIKNDGRIAFILPMALASGISWEPTRKLLADKFHIEYIFTSHEPSRWNFSENTDLSEVMFIAQRKSTKDEKRKTTFINLWRNPSNSIEALSTFQCIQDTAAQDVDDYGISNLVDNNRKIGETLTVPTTDISNQWWGGSFAQNSLNITARKLRDGLLYINNKFIKTLPICQLGTLGKIGHDARDIHDGFKNVAHKTAYGAFWNHESDFVNTILQSPNSFLEPRTEPAPGRKKILPSSNLWQSRSRLLIAWRFWLITHKLTSIFVDKEVLSNTWFTICLNNNDERIVKCLSLWLNSTFGIMSMAFSSIRTRGPWIQLKKPTIQNLPVIDVTKISNEQIDLLSSSFDRCSKLKLLSFSNISEDASRALIDKALCDALDIGDISIIRDTLGIEPIFTNTSL